MSWTLSSLELTGGNLLHKITRCEVCEDGDHRRNPGGGWKPGGGMKPGGGAPGAPGAA